jgi:hypothetical protein
VTALWALILISGCRETPRETLVVLTPLALSHALTQQSLDWGIAHPELDLVHDFALSPDLGRRLGREPWVQVLITATGDQMRAALASGLVVDAQPLGTGPVQIALAPTATATAQAYRSDLKMGALDLAISADAPR